MKVIITSNKKTSGTSSKGTIRLRERITGNYKLLDFEMTDNIYNVTENNNKMYVNVNEATDHILTLTKGFYTASQLTTEVKTQLDTIPSHTFTATHSSKTGKMTIQISGSNTFGFTFGTNTANSARKLLGFNEADNTTLATQTSPNAIDLNPYKVIYINFEEDSYQHIVGGHENGFTASLAISGESSFGGVLRYSPEDSGEQVLSFTKSPLILSYRFIDENDNAVNLNGSDWIMTLGEC